VAAFLHFGWNEGTRSLSRCKREVPSSALILLKAAEKQLFAFNRMIISPNP